LQLADKKFVNANAVSKNRLAATLLAAEEPLFIPDQQASIVADKNVLGGFANST